MKFQISDEILDKSGISKEQLLLEIALILYQRESITLGQASELAKIHQREFQLELGKRKIPIHYDIEEFEQDLNTVNEI